ncbi:MAG: HAMP domain-containing histidine kinase [Oscillospiraceae bacterium]|nr:HAMP domain-containing histidine kinase [Oscillospiraceae bacterium]
MHSTYVRNFLNTATMVIVSFMLIGVTFGLVSRNVFLTETRDQVQTSSREVSRAAAAYARENDLGSLELRMSITTVAASTEEHIFIVAPDGKVVSCSDAELGCHHLGTELDRELFDSLPQTGNDTYFDDLHGFYPNSHYTIVTPLRSAGGTLLGYLFVSRDTRAALSVWQTIVPLFFMISLVVLMLALAFGLASSRYLTRPLQQLANAARQFGRGDLTARVDIHRDDEIGELADAFNSMADSLEKSETRRREFIANVSHELKTPMTTISGFADGILDGTIPPESEKRYLQTISSETKRLARLVRSMLELSRLQAGDREALLNQSFDIAEVLRLTLINFADKIDQRRLEVDFQVPEDSVIVRGNADAITQVVYNLFDNAIKFSREGTELGISLWKDNAKAYVSVRNQGSTIPEAEIPLLFDRFHKSDRSRSQDRDGVGLGLYIVKTILNNHGEDIAVTSRQGVTDFVFTLTLKQESKKQTGEKQYG